MSAGSPIGKVVERQMRNWELARRQRLAVPVEKRPELADFICLSRIPGAGGKEVASMLGAALGWAVFDKELLQAMAGDDAVREQIYTSMDERDLSWCEEMLRALAQPTFVKNDYFHRLTDTVLSLARQGHAVFLGRAADLILPRSMGFRVRLVAPMATCISRFAKLHNLAEERAREEINRIEQERAEFIRRHFQVDPHDPARHDLVVNLEYFSPAQAVELVLTARRLKGTGP